MSAPESKVWEGFNFIGGEKRGAIDGTTLDVINPATGEVCATMPRSKQEDVEEATKAAVDAFNGPWRKTSSSARADLLDKIANGLEARAKDLIELESQDSGKTIAMASKVDIPRAIMNFKFFAGQLRHDQTGFHKMHDAINYTLRHPIGVCGLITPWNLPLYLLSWKVAPALAMGNTIVAKPSEITPRTACMLAEIMKEAGLPDGVFNLIHGFGHEAGQAIIEHKDIRCISFTGGTATGKIVARYAAPMFKKLSLELGGKNATIVFDDAEMPRAVEGAFRAAFTNQGQVCLAGSRILVQRKLYEEFVEKFKDLMRELRVGDPSDETTTIGPLSSAMHLKKVLTYVEIAKDEGGTVFGGEVPALDGKLAGGSFITPALVTGLPHTARCSVEEVFGPFVTIHPFDTEDDAVEMANCTSYGLAGSVWTTDLKTAHRVCDRIETGMLWVNCWLHRDLRVPFGGVKDSGTGREGGTHSLEFYSEMKNVCVHLGEP